MSSFLIQFLLISRLVSADIPVHCDFKDIPGVWELEFARLQAPPSGPDGDMSGLEPTGDRSDFQNVHESFDRRCGQTVPGLPDGWQDLTPFGTARTERPLYEKYFLTDRLQPVASMTVLLSEGNQFEDTQVKILKRDDREVDPDVRWGGQSKERDNEEREQSERLTILAQISLEEVQKRGFFKGSKDIGLLDEDADEGLFLHELSKEQRSLLSALVRLSFQSASNFPNFQSQVRSSIQSFLNTLDIINPKQSLYTSFLAYIYSIPSSTKALRESVEFSRRHWNSLGGQHLTGDLQPGAEGQWSMVYDMGPLAKFRFDQSGDDSTVITEHSLWAPSRFVVPPKQSTDESDFKVLNRHTECHKTLVGRWKQILMDGLAEKHNLVRSELCWYGIRVKSWDDWVLEHPNWEKEMEQDGEIGNSEVKGSRNAAREKSALTAQKRREQRGGAISSSEGGNLFFMDPTQRKISEGFGSLRYGMGGFLVPDQLDSKMCALEPDVQFVTAGDTFNSKSGAGRPLLCPAPDLLKVIAQTDDSDLLRLLMQRVLPVLVVALLLLGSLISRRLHRTLLSDVAGSTAFNPRQSAERISLTGQAAIIQRPSLFSMRGLKLLREKLEQDFLLKHVSRKPLFWKNTYKLFLGLLGCVFFSLCRAKVERYRVERRILLHAEAELSAMLQHETAFRVSSSNQFVPKEESLGAGAGDADVVRAERAVVVHNERASALKKKFLDGFTSSHNKQERQRREKKARLASAALRAGKHLYDLSVDDLLDEYPEPQEVAIDGYLGEDRFLYNDPKHPDDRVWMDKNGWKRQKNFDWRFVSKRVSKQPGGSNSDFSVVSGFVPDVVDQGNCGSCFAAGLTGMATGRYWIQHPTSKEDFRLSPKRKKRVDNEGMVFDRFAIMQQVQGVDYNQGCEGGDPALACLWLQERPGVTTECWNLLKGIADDETRLRAQETDPKCKHQVQAVGFKYMAGAIGGCGISGVCEELMMRELWQNGPVSVAIDVKDAVDSAGVHEITVLDGFFFAV